jgi:hypothetical protein
MPVSVQLRSGYRTAARGTTSAATQQKRSSQECSSCNRLHLRVPPKRPVNGAIAFYRSSTITPCSFQLSTLRFILTYRVRKTDGPQKDICTFINQNQRIGDYAAAAPKHCGGSQCRPFISAGDRQIRQHVRHDLLLSPPSFSRSLGKHGGRLPSRQAGR